MCEILVINVFEMIFIAQFINYKACILKKNVFYNSYIFLKFNENVCFDWNKLGYKKIN